MPPAAEESHPPPSVPNEPEDAEGEESDDYDIGVGSNGLFWFPSEQSTLKDGDDDDEYAGEDEEDEGEPNGVSVHLMSH
jgi:hypothetical protein